MINTRTCCGCKEPLYANDEMCPNYLRTCQHGGCSKCLGTHKPNFEKDKNLAVDIEDEDGYASSDEEYTGKIGGHVEMIDPRVFEAAVMERETKLDRERRDAENVWEKAQEAWEQEQEGTEWKA